MGLKNKSKSRGKRGRTLRWLLLLTPLLLTFCTASKEVTKDTIDELYKKYRKGKKQAVNNLVKYYKDPNLPQDIRLAALKRIIDTNDPVAFEALRLSVRKGEGINYDLYLTMIQALSTTKDPDNVKAVLAGLNKLHQGYVKARNEILRLVRDQTDEKAVGLLLSLYAEAKEDFIALQQTITLSLGKMEDARVVPVLMAIASDPKIPLHIRNEAVDALARKNDPAVAELLAKMLQDPRTQSQIKRLAISATDELKDERLILALLEALNNERLTYTSMVESITRALGNYDDPRLKPVLLQVAREQALPTRIRRRALKALVKYKDRQVALKLIRMLRKPENFVFYRDIQAVVNAIGDKDLITTMEATALQAQQIWETL